MLTKWFEMDNIVLGGLASSCATVFTNPLEVYLENLKLSFQTLIDIL